MSSPSLPSSCATTGDPTSSARAWRRSRSARRATPSTWLARRAGRRRLWPPARARTAGFNSSSRLALRLDRFLGKRQLVEEGQICEVFRPSTRELVNSQLGETEDRHLAKCRRSHGSIAPCGAKAHAGDAGEHVDSHRQLPHHRDAIGLGEPPPVPRGRFESEFSDCRGDPSCVGRGWIDQHVETLRVSWPTVGGQRVRADEQEPDAMALQRVQKLVPFG